MSTSPSPNKPGDELVLRCPFCKARVASTEAECPICGETLTEQNVLRMNTSVKIFSKPLLPQADDTATPPTSVPLPHKPEMAAPPLPPTPTPTLIAKPRTEPLKPPRPLTQPNPRVSVPPTPPSTSPSGYMVGLLVGFAVIVLGAAILIGVNLAQQTTTEAKAKADEIHQQAAKITVVYSETQATPTPLASAATPAPTAQLTELVVATAVATVTRAVMPAVSLTPTLEIIPILSPTPTAQPTLAPSATLRPSATPKPLNTAIPVATRTALPTTPPIATATPVVAQWDVVLAAARYETSSRPTQACSAFDPNDEVRKFTFTLRITQTTGKDLAANDWGVAAFVGDARVQQVCYFKTEGPTPPALPNGAARQVTLSAFVGQGQSVTMLVVGDTTGSAGKLCVRETQAVACN